MMVLVSNLSGGGFHYLAGKFPGRIGHLYSPDGWRKPPKWMPYALDNGAYTGFNPEKFSAMLEKAKLCGKKPSWVAVPDVVGDRAATLKRWAEWSPKLATYRWPLAFVVQDGMTPADVPDAASVVFVGGSPPWKYRTLEVWAKRFRRVHVGRINTHRLLWICHDFGVESVDGTGWWHDKQFAQLEEYLEAATALRKRQEQLCL